MDTIKLKLCSQKIIKTNDDGFCEVNLRWWRRREHIDSSFFHILHPSIYSGDYTYIDVYGNVTKLESFRISFVIHAHC